MHFHKTVCRKQNDEGRVFRLSVLKDAVQSIIHLLILKREPSFLRSGW